MLTSREYVRVPPLKTGSGASLLVRERSALGAGVGGGPTRVTLVPLLLPGFGSVTADDATAVFVRVEPAEAVTLTTIVMVAFAEDAMLPRLAVTVPLVPTAGPVQVPWLEVQETKVVPLGSGSLTITPVAGSGPPL